MVPAVQPSVGLTRVQGVIYLGPNEAAATHDTVQGSELWLQPGVSSVQHLEWGRRASTMAFEAGRMTVAIVVSSWWPPRIIM